MANGYAKEIQNRIGAAPDGTIFIVSDFADVADQRNHTQEPEPACAGWDAPAYFERRF